MRSPAAPVPLSVHKETSLLPIHLSAPPDSFYRRKCSLITAVPSVLTTSTPEERWSAQLSSTDTLPIDILFDSTVLLPTQTRHAPPPPRLSAQVTPPLPGAPLPPPLVPPPRAPQSRPRASTNSITHLNGKSKPVRYDGAPWGGVAPACLLGHPYRHWGRPLSAGEAVGRRAPPGHVPCVPRLRSRAQ